MKFSRLLSPTLKETPADAQIISHQLMVRAGLIRKVASGIYSLLPLGLKIMRKFEAIVREELSKVDAQEVLLPMVTPATLWQESGRWEKYGRELCRLKDRHDADFCLGPTHEEVITDLVRGTIRSYKELPINLYQIQTKFRDEIRPRFGLMRGREFIMKDAYSFHATPQDLDETYQKMATAYTAIFKRCGLSFKMVEADSGAIGGDSSAEFMVTADTGEDAIIECDTCQYGANIEAAKTRCPIAPTQTIQSPLNEVATPGKKTIQDVSVFLDKPERDTIKSLLYKIDSKWVGVLIRGDLEINEIKLSAQFGGKPIEKPTNDAIEAEFRLPVGYIGPIGAPNAIHWVADHSILGMPSAVIGANKSDTHIENAVLNRDFVVDTITDLHVAVAGDPCPKCETGHFKQVRGIEVGHIFKLGTTYSKKMNATFLDETGREMPFIMGCYGIGIGRTVAAAIEQHHDEYGIAWPRALAPFEASIIVANIRKPELVGAGDRVYEACRKAGMDVILDDRDCSAGVKFKDSELIGIPILIVIGKTFNENGTVEIKKRGQKDGILSSLNTVTQTLKLLIDNGA